MSIIMLDTETTGLLQPEGVNLDYQPYIVEIGALKINSNYEIIGELCTLIKPPIPLSEKIIKIHNITNEMLIDQPTFSSVYKKLAELFLGCHTLVAHNLPFDIGMFKVELIRIEKLLQFPWPPIHFCTVEQSFHLKGHRLKLQELYKMATGKEEVEGAHRAKKDALALLESYKWLKKEK